MCPQVLVKETKKYCTIYILRHLVFNGASCQMIKPWALIATKGLHPLQGRWWHCTALSQTPINMLASIVVTSASSLAMKCLIVLGGTV
jgi:hypothetical protein